MGIKRLQAIQYKHENGIDKAAQYLLEDRSCRLRGKRITHLVKKDQMCELQVFQLCRR